VRGLLAALALLLLPAGAPASSVQMEAAPSPECSGCARQPTQALAALRVTAPPGEANALTIARLPDAVVVTETGAALEVGPGCVREGEQRARCALPDGSDGRQRIVLHSVSVSTGDGDDRVELAAAAVNAADVALGGGDDALTATAGPVDADAGAGDDRMRTADAADSLTGGPGADTVASGGGDDTLIDAEAGVAHPVHFIGLRPVLAARAAAAAPASRDIFDGGGGRDLVSYSGRREALRADLRSGRAGEDRLRAIEGVQGGDGADVIAGAGGADHLFGGEGRDRLTGRGGADHLYEGEVVRGGSGADRIWFARHLASLGCGPGYDYVWSPPRTATLTDCEVAGADEGELPIRIHARPLASGELLLTASSRSTGFAPGTRLGARVVRSDGTVLASGVTRARNGRLRGLRAPLTPAGRRLLAAPGRLRATVRARIAEAGGRGREMSFRVRL
jgi:hypothetical protein